MALGAAMTEPRQRDPRTNPQAGDVVQLLNGCYRRVLTREGDRVDYTVGDGQRGPVFSKQVSSWRVLCLGGRVERVMQQLTLFGGGA